MAMISGGDESAKNAFRAYLRDDSSQLSIISTEEMSPGDVLEVKNLADAIERAERVLRESSQPRDMFADLGGGKGSDKKITDDASGPAVYAKPTLTPVPPSLANVMATPLPLPPTMPSSLTTQPIPAVLYIPTEPLNDDDAYLQPAGRMRHFAEETLDGYRPDSTMEVRLKGAGERRKTFTVAISVALAVLAVALVAGGIFAFMPKSEASAAEPPKVEKTEAKPVEPKAADPKVVAPPKQDEAPAVRTMNVNDLPSAK